MIRSTRPVAPFLVLLAIAFMVAGIGCTKTVAPVIVDRYKPQTSEKNVLNNLEVAWEEKDIERYAALLADDFQFYFDEATRIKDNLPVYWTRLDDSTNTGKVFASPITRGIQVEHKNMKDPVTVPQVGRETWTMVDVLESYLEVEMDPTPENPEGMTMLVEGSIQHFYFRRGFTAADTDTVASKTAKLYYLVEWVDMGESQ